MRKEPPVQICQLFNNHIKFPPNYLQNKNKIAHSLQDRCRFRSHRNEDQLDVVNVASGPFRRRWHLRLLLQRPPRSYSLTGADVDSVRLMCGLWRASSFEAAVTQCWNNRGSEGIAEGHSQALTLPTIFTHDGDSLSGGKTPTKSSD